MNSIKFDKGYYKDKSLSEIKKDLSKQGYKPIIIDEVPKFVLKSHKHKESHIIVQIKETMYLISNKIEYMMEPGDKVFIPPNVEHAAKCSDNGSKYLWLEF